MSFLSRTHVKLDVSGGFLFALLDNLQRGAETLTLLRVFLENTVDEVEKQNMSVA